MISDFKDYLYHERPSYLKLYGEPQHAFFINNIGKRMQGYQHNDTVKAIVKRTNNEEIISKEITLHCMRHTIACHLIDRGATIEYVRDFLGHTEIDTASLYARRRKRKEKLLYAVEQINKQTIKK